MIADIVKLQAIQDQDEAAAMAWWKEASGADQMRIWLAIQRLGGMPELELISRFAQLGATHIALLVEKGP